MTTEEEKKDLEKLTRTKLVEAAGRFPDIVGASGMSKEELVEAVRAEMIKAGEEVAEKPAPKAPSGKKAAGKQPDRNALKAKLKDLKGKRREALEAKDSVRLKRIRARYKKVSRLLSRSGAAAG